MGWGALLLVTLFSLAGTVKCASPGESVFEKLFRDTVPPSISKKCTPIFWTGTNDGVRKGALGSAWRVKHSQGEGVVKLATKNEWEVCVQLMTDPCSGIARVFQTEKKRHQGKYQYFVVYEYAGETLDNVQNISEDSAIKILTSVANALSSLFKRGYVHGDIHAGNVTKSGKLIDLGNTFSKFSVNFEIATKYDIRRLRFLMFRLMGLNSNSCWSSNTDMTCIFRFEPNMTLTSMAKSYPRLSSFALSDSTSSIQQLSKTERTILPEKLQREWKGTLDKFGLFKFCWKDDVSIDTIINQLNALQEVDGDSMPVTDVICGDIDSMPATNTTLFDAWEKVNKRVPHSVPTRRLVVCGLSNDHDAPHGLFILVPILLILMMVFFMYRKPIQNYFSGSNSEKPSYGGLRNIRKKAPIRHF